ncbi:MAG: N-acetyltransferase GCN5 [Promethearchaeota archaeon CR_4]|nr:MAG: N-acetyltransferase GCN5 [Candidatus Lokiarchaeota archaeon CR_4]
MQTSLPVREITAVDFPVIERLFGPNGACAGCWCMFWRMRASEWRLSGRNEDHRLGFKALLESSKVYAAMAFKSNEPVGWVTYGPRESFPRVENSRVLKRAAPLGTWSIVCFYIPRQWRGKGIANRLLDAAVGYCKAHGATEIEAFPVELKDPSHQKPATDIYTGVATQFVRIGFVPVPRPKNMRPIYVKKQ